MDYYQCLTFFEGLGFQLAQIDDKDVLLLELEDLEDWGYYAIASDLDHEIPTSLDEPLLWTLYDDNDAFLWDVTIENSRYLKMLFEESDTLEDVLMSLRNFREDSILESVLEEEEDLTSY